MKIVHELMYSNEACYGDLLAQSGLSNDDFKHHLRVLIDAGLIHKIDTGLYTVTGSGKEFSGTLHHETPEVEKRPKTSVLLVIEREHNGRTEYLQQIRGKQPWFGYYVYVTGKIAWGKDVQSVAKRELKEETGLEAEFKLVAISRERDFDRVSGNVMEDKVFFVMHCKEPRGELLNTREGSHMWLTKEEYLAHQHIDGAERFFDYLNKPELIFDESDYYFNASEF